jgi:hypothetical protein
MIDKPRRSKQRCLKSGRLHMAMNLSRSKELGKPEEKKPEAAALFKI